MDALPILRISPLLCGPAFVGGLTTRRGFPSATAGAGDAAAQRTESDRAALRERLADVLGVSVARLAWSRQVHGAQALKVARPGLQGEADALVCADPALVLLVSVADCCPVLAWDSAAGAFGAAHAGWRGLACGVLGALIAALAGAGARPDRVRAWIGPSIGPCCFEIGAEVAVQFDGSCVRAAGPLERPHLDLRRASALQLAAAGVAPERIQACPDCTACRTELYFSYRRDRGICGRHLAYITRGGPA
jgi:YfiH family protein